MNWLNLFFSLFLLVLLFKSNFCGNPVDNCPKLPPHTPKDVNDLAPSVKPKFNLILTYFQNMIQRILKW